jgi:hypothetical protein
VGRAAAVRELRTVIGDDAPAATCAGAKTGDTYSGDEAPRFPAVIGNRRHPDVPGAIPIHACGEMDRSVCAATLATDKKWWAAESGYGSRTMSRSRTIAIVDPGPNVTSRAGNGHTLDIPSEK